jgi:putative dimethyl sulfoxide reductase chaperone
LVMNLIGRVFYKYPSDSEQVWIRSLKDEDVFSEVPFAGDREETKAGLSLLHDWSQKAFTNDAFDRLQGDYTRLFLGPDKLLAAPWESVYVTKERLTFQEQTLAVRAWYKRFGLEVEKLHQEPDDHIGLEVLFLSKLAELGAQALDAGDQEKFEEFLNAQRDFLQQHLGAWALTWCGLMEKHARTDFYLGMTALLHGALTELAEILGVNLAKDITR